MDEPKKQESVIDIIKFGLLTLAIVLPIRAFIAQPFIVQGASMYPTFSTGQYIIVDELSYHLRAPERGEVVIFKYPNQPSKYFIKRIIGLPGETVEVINGKVYVTTTEGKRAEFPEPYIHEPTPVDTKTILGLSEYYVMGDNRAESFDSRYWGALDKKFITGRALVRLFPFSKVSYLPGANNTSK